MSRAADTRAAMLAVAIDARGVHRRRALRERIGLVIETLGGPATPRASTANLLSRLDEALHEPTNEQIWLTLAVLRGQLPDSELVLATTRSARLDGALHALTGALTAPRSGWPLSRGPWPSVRVVTDEVLVDLHHTARTGLATGIQRVARQTAQRWRRDHSISLVGWTPDLRALRALEPAEQDNALHGTGVVAAPGRSAEILVPWGCRYVLPELLTEPPRARALQGVLRFSGSTGSMIGFDCVPLTSARTTADGMGYGFCMMLTAIAHGHRIATISQAAAVEYSGWRRMLSGAGMVGPQIAPIMLPVEANEPSPAALEDARDLLISGQLPMVLCVGSHEPRKNHLAVLHAAELLWRQGHRFALVFVGGNGWHGEQFESGLSDLRSAGRPVEAIRALSDELLWAAYRLAHCVVFPSLNEGFGLPVAEALASGTPVVTSRFGSMREIAAQGGALLVDPTDDHDVTDALRTMLTDTATYQRLSREAGRHDVRTWDHYAAEAWEFLVDSVRPAFDEPLPARAGER
jgi:glycosyltransferase involved in cell wall biosynthesis